MSDKWLAGAIDYGILGLLTLLSVMAVAVALERYMFYKWVRIADVLRNLGFFRVAVQTKDRT
jgi:hypothetical protein